MLSRVVDRATGLAGLVVLLCAVSWPLPPWQAWLTLPVIVLAGRWPLLLPTATSESLIIGLDSALLVLLGLTLPFDQALLVWSCSIVAGELTAARNLDTRLFNAGVCIVSGALALLVLTALPVTQRTTSTGLAATVLAAAVYFVVDYLWSAVSVAAAERTPLRGALRSSGLLLAFACFVAVDSLGFLAAVVLRTQPWAVLLLTLPFVSLLVATHSWSRLRRTEQRSGALSTAAVALQQAASVDQVERLLLHHAARVVRAPAAAWQDAAGTGGTPALTFVAGGVRRELVMSQRTTGEDLTAHDLDALRVLVGVAEQAAQRLVLHTELRRSAACDPLTGLANRSAFREALDSAVADGDRIALLYCDLDGFKQVNDRRGHAVGDLLLVEVAARLATSVRPDDLPVRLGGDEFAVLLRGLPDDDPVAHAEQVAQRVCEALGAPYEIAGAPAVVSASIGLSARLRTEQPEDLVSASDAAMYAAKARGGNTVCVSGRLAVGTAVPRASALTG